MYTSSDHHGTVSRPIASRLSDTTTHPGAFPVVLHEALRQLELLADGIGIAAFASDGKAFQIKNKFLLEKRVLPVFSPRMKVFASLQRQLNHLYNFKRIRGPAVNRGAYHHNLFVRELPTLTQKMKQTKVKRVRDFEGKN